MSTTSTRARSTWRRNRCPRPSTFARSLDEPGDVGDDELEVVVDPHHAEVRLERRERVVRDLGLRRRDAADERALARVREADERDIGHQLQLEQQPALLAVLALLRERRRPPRVRQEAGVPTSSAAAGGGPPSVTVVHEVGEHRAGVHLLDDRALRNRDGDVAAGRRRGGPCPCHECRRSPAGADDRGYDSSEATLWSATSHTSPPDPPSPPSGPPFGT